MKIFEYLRKHRYKNTVRYYLLITLVLAILFFSGDFGLIDVQKTAIVMAVGIDKDENGFTVTSQIAMPQQGEQGKNTQTIQVSYSGKTVAEAFGGINAKTGWYPKLVFCKLIILGESAVQDNAFDALGFFLLDEYLSDDCLVATCEGEAKELLNTKALGEPTGSVAMQKVLSPHAERVGQVLPNTLREFAIGYYGNAKAGFLPILKKEQAEEAQTTAQGGEQGGSGGQSGQSGEQKTQEEPAFSAGETALFVAGKRVGTLNKEETFAFNVVKNDLKLANYSIDNENDACTLVIKHNERKRKLAVGKDGKARLQIRLTLTAGLLDTARITNAEDAGDVPKDAFPLAQRKLKAQISSTFEKCRNLGCDLFEVSSLLEKYEDNRFEALQDGILQNTSIDAEIVFRNVR